MKKLALSALVFLAACGFRSTPPPGGGYVTPRPTTMVFPDQYPDYIIDANDPVITLYNAYAITANSDGDFYMSWRGDGAPRQFTGHVYCPAGCDLTAVFSDLNLGDSVTTIANNHVGFDAVTDAREQTLSLSAFDRGGGVFPATFDLYIDGVPAINGGVVFPSGGQLATSNVMPFNLVPDTAVFSDKAELAPQFKIPNGAKTFTTPAPRPRAGGSHTESKPQVVEASAQQ